MAVEAARYLFLDKDGTLVPDLPYNVDPGRISLQPGAAPALRRLHQAGFQFVVVTNQAGVARGYFEEAALRGVEERLRQLLAEQAGVPLDGFYYCPHHPQGSRPAYAIACECRKPQPGLLTRAAQDLGIRLDTAWMIGDILNDVEAGRRAGCRTILLDTGGETEWQTGPLRQPDFVAANWEEAADYLLSQTQHPAMPGLQPGPEAPAQTHDQ